MAAKKKTESKKTAKKKASKKKSGKTASAGDDGMVKLADLAAEAGISGQAARQKLRNAEIGRPEGSRWAWKEGSKDLKKAREALDL